ncbi:MAG: PEP-CTERM sorting domain-containing protein [Opitutus sp.]|nr:PEP-CTERM sorting domain-containing protein [Opitutus sp.]
MDVRGLQSAQHGLHGEQHARRGCLGASDQYPYANFPTTGKIHFTEYNPRLTITWVSGNHNGWFDHEIRPTPEPSTYGALSLTACLGLLGWRRFQRGSKTAGR